MPIVFDCVCGTEIEALDGQAGRKLICPSCRSDLTVPPRTTAVRPEVIPDLGVDTSPRLRLARRRGRLSPSPAGPLAVLAVAAVVALAAFGELTISRPILATAPAPAPPRAPAYRTGQQERDDADERARIALTAWLRAEADVLEMEEADEARRARLRAEADAAAARGDHMHAAVKRFESLKGLRP